MLGALPTRVFSETFEISTASSAIRRDDYHLTVLRTVGPLYSGLVVVCNDRHGLPELPENPRGLRESRSRECYEGTASGRLVHTGSRCESFTQEDTVPTMTIGSSTETSSSGTTCLAERSRSPRWVSELTPKHLTNSSEWQSATTAECFPSTKCFLTTSFPSPSVAVSVNPDSVCL